MPVNSTLVKKSLERLRKENLPHLDWRTLLTVTAGELSAEDVAALDAYFVMFCAAAEHCIRCGWALGGFFGSFVWGIAHGEGKCSRCDWPARGIHYNVGPIKRLAAILQYHPDVIKRGKRGA